MEQDPRTDLDGPDLQQVTRSPSLVDERRESNGAVAASSLESPGPDANTPATTGQPLDVPGSTSVSTTREAGGLRFWLRPIILAVLTAMLLGLTWWDQQRLPDRPPRPEILRATTPPGSTVSATDPALSNMLVQLESSLKRRDARALADLASPGGLVVAAFSGTLPDLGYDMPDSLRLSQDILNGAQITVLGWRPDGRGRVVVLTDGWKRRALRMSINSTLELTPIVALGLQPQDGKWYWHWLLVDSTNLLTDQARTVPWQPLPS